MSDPGVILLVSWDGGGNVPPMLALGRQLTRRGHVVRVLGPPSLRDHVTHAALPFTAFTKVVALDRTPGRALEDQVEAFVSALADEELCTDVAAELERQRPDVVVIDCMQIAAFNAAEASGISTVSFVHFLPCFAAESRLNGLTSRLNVSRASLGIEAFDTTAGLYEQQWARCAAVLAATIPQLDNATPPLPANLRYVGPILEPDPPDWSWDLPWPPDHPDPLVVVSFRCFTASVRL